jgi:hypothetical protein
VSPLWALPLLIVTVGIVLVALAARRTAAAAAELTERAATFGALRHEAAGLRADVDAVVARARALSWRADRSETDK